MKVENITKPNKKGQIVIPKKLRDELGIGPGQWVSIEKRGEGLYIKPIKEIIPSAKTENSYLKILEKTRGSWSSEDWQSIRNQRKKTERKASERRKEEW